MKPATHASQSLVVRGVNGGVVIGIGSLTPLVIDGQDKYCMLPCLEQDY